MSVEEIGDGLDALDLKEEAFEMVERNQEMLDNFMKWVSTTKPDYKTMMQAFVKDRFINQYVLSGLTQDQFDTVFEVLNEHVTTELHLQLRATTGVDWRPMYEWLKRNPCMQTLSLESCDADLDAVLGELRRGKTGLLNLSLTDFKLTPKHMEMLRDVIDTSNDQYGLKLGLSKCEMGSLEPVIRQQLKSLDLERAVIGDPDELARILALPGIKSVSIKGTRRATETGPQALEWTSFAPIIRIEKWYQKLHFDTEQLSPLGWAIHQNKDGEAHIPTEAFQKCCEQFEKEFHAVGDFSSDEQDKLCSWWEYVMTSPKARMVDAAALIQFIAKGKSESFPTTCL